MFHVSHCWSENFWLNAIWEIGKYLTRRAGRPAKSQPTNDAHYHHHHKSCRTLWLSSLVAIIVVICGLASVSDAHSWCGKTQSAGNVGRITLSDEFDCNFFFFHDINTQSVPVVRGTENSKWGYRKSVTHCSVANFTHLSADGKICIYIQRNWFLKRKIYFSCSFSSESSNFQFLETFAIETVSLF